MRIDFHMHTKYSDCGLNSVQTMVKHARKVGLNGVAITDHDTTKAWKTGRELAQKYGLVFINGEEVTSVDGHHILGLFLNELVKPGSSLEIIDAIKSQGGFAVVAHPFDRRGNYTKADLKLCKAADAIEVLSARVRDKRSNTSALQTAEENKLVGTAGSDAHTFFELGYCWNNIECSDAEEMRKKICKGDFEVEGRTTPLAKTYLSRIVSKARKCLV